MITFWVVLLATTTLLYVLLDGFDLGVGILFGFARDEDHRAHMLAAVSPVWDGNETWLIFTGTILWGAFPRVYATLLSALYLPITLMLGALILRGVSFEFRYKARSSRWLWDLSFFAGSVVASFTQGLAIGAVAGGLPLRDGHYVGGPFGWLSPFALLCGVALCFGNALLGAGWLVLKSVGRLRDLARRLLRPLTFGVFGFLTVAFFYALSLDLRIARRWTDQPFLLVLPAVGAIAALVLIVGAPERDDRRPFRMAALLYLSGFATLAASFWPFMIPFAVTIDEAAAPASSLRFMFWGAGLFVAPLTLVYTAVVYRVFRGKLVGGYEGH